MSGAKAVPLLVIAGGGTGGHVYPGLAIADAARALADVEIVFVGTARGIEARVVPGRGYRLELLDVVPMRGGGLGRAVRGGFVAARATAAATAVVRALHPAAVVSIGGYAAGPVSLASALLGAPLAIVEPNAALGLTQKLLAPIAKRAYVAWSEAARGIRPAIVRTFGVPLRPGFAPSPYLADYTLGGMEDATGRPFGTRRPRILVLGGSQGADSLNERLPLAVAEAGRMLGGSIEVVHQAGDRRDDAVRSAYLREDVVHARVVPYLDDVAAAIARADLVVARSGAGTVAEIAAIGRASLLVPFPFAADDHQAKNARALEASGGSVCVRQEAADSVRLALEIARSLGNPHALSSMADAARRFGKPDAARAIAEDLLELAGVATRVPSAAGAHGRSEIRAAREVH